MKKIATYLAIGLSVTLLTACGSTGGVKTTAYQGTEAEKKIAKRAEQRWAYLSSGEYDKAWEYFTPGHKRFESKEAFDLRMRQKRVDWKGAKVVDVDCDETESSCNVTVVVEYIYHSPKPMVGDVEASTELEEKWIKLKNRWYYVQPGLKQKLLK